MRLLLDTHILLWWLNDNSELSEESRALISSPDNIVFVSVASLWEIIIKVRNSKLTADLDKIEQSLTTNDFGRLDIQRSHLVALAHLRVVHKDPFDHMLVAQSIAEDLTLISDDRILQHYPIKVMPNRRSTRSDQPAT